MSFCPARELIAVSNPLADFDTSRQGKRRKMGREGRRGKGTGGKKTPQNK